MENVWGESERERERERAARRVHDEEVADLTSTRWKYFVNKKGFCTGTKGAISYLRYRKGLKQKTTTGSPFLFFFFDREIREMCLFERLMVPSCLQEMMGQ
jgi:hypothetical protein